MFLGNASLSFVIFLKKLLIYEKEVDAIGNDIHETKDCLCNDSLCRKKVEQYDSLILFSPDESQ